MGRKLGVSRLYVARSFTQRNRWRLFRARTGEVAFVWVDGECSALTFATAREAVAFGMSRYNERARRANLNNDTPFT